MMEFTTNWLGSILAASVILSVLTVGTHWLLRKRSASERLTVSVCGIVALLAVALATLLPFRLTIPSDAPEWVAQIPSTLALGSEPRATSAPSAAPVVNSAAPVASPINWISLAYLVGAGILALRFAVGLVGAARLKAKSTQLRGLVRISSEITMPLAFGGPNPCVLMPSDVELWPEERVNEVYQHELAHLRNRDWTWLVLSNLTTILFWFNPAVWLISRNLRIDMERLADDVVLMQGAAASSYATTLVDLARNRQEGFGSVGIAFGCERGLSDRVRAILNPDQPRRKLPLKRLAIGLLVTATACGALAALATDQDALFLGSQGKQTDRRPSVPGTPKTGYKAKLTDGRTLEILQVTQFDKSGRPESWKPDGTPIPASKAAKVPMVKGKPWVKALLVRYPVLDRSSGSDISVRAADDGRGGYDYFSFSAGKVLPVENGYRYGACYFGLPSPSSESAFRIMIQDAPTEVVFDWKADGSMKDHRPGVKDFAVKQVSHVDYPGEKFALQGYEGPLTRISWTNGLPAEYTIMDSFGFKNRRFPIGYVNVRTENGQRVTYINGPLSDLKTYAVLMSEFFECEVKGVKVKPNR